MTDIEVYQQPAAAVAVTSDVDSWVPVLAHVADLAAKIANSPFVPDGLRGSVPATAAAILTARELGVPPMTGLANIHVIKNKPALSALLMRALIQGQGHDWQDVKVTDTEVTIRARRKGETDWTEASFTAAQARTAHIDLGGYPQDKLYARATSRLARRKFADVIAGMPYSAEELEDEPGDPPAIEAKPTGRVTAAEITGRQAAPQTASPATPQPRAADAAATPHAEPVAGEVRTAEPDETDYDTPGTVSTPQITAIWTNLGSAFKFGRDEKDQARAVCAHIIGRELASTKDMSRNEARTVLDTLANWREIAEQHEESPRDFLVALMAEGQATDA